MKRKLTLDICDYKNTVLCNLYDNSSDIFGQASNVFVTYERNGWKTITFTIPSVCYGEEGEERNFRLDYLISDYRLRLVDDYEIDWYIISENRITHDNFSKNVEVTAGHVSQLLKIKNLGLEFSDEEGNNVGTAEQLLTTILDGTGWHVGEVAEFLEEDGTVKQRSLNEPAKTGAFKMISDMCELFDAKAVYHGDTYTVDILPMNPFSETPEGEIPKDVGLDNMIELHYDRNIHGLSKTTNTENMCTKFYAYGAYGDANLGMCSIQTCEHKEYEFISEGYIAGSVLKFTDDDNVTHYFKSTELVSSGDKLVWSKKDFTSQTYLWNDSTGTAYHTCNLIANAIQLPQANVVMVQNLTPELFNFNYYDEVGLFSNEHLQAVAKYQRDMPEYYETSIENSTAFVDSLHELSDLAQSNSGFLKIDISGYEVDATDPDDPSLRLVINTSTGDNGVVYRSDYTEAKKNYFKWNVAQQIKPNGLPIPSSASILFILHDTDPVTFEKFYLKAITDSHGNYYLDSKGKPGTFDYGLEDDEPSKITLCADIDDVPAWNEKDRFYLFCTDSMSGTLGAAITTDDALPDKLSEALKDDTVYHQIFFGEEVPEEADLANYGWFYKYNKYTLDVGELYFCWTERFENTWHKVYVQETIPEYEDGAYFYDRAKATFYHAENNEWVLLDSTEEKRVAQRINIAFNNCRSRDMAYHGRYEKYNFTGALPKGNYAMKSDYDFYWVFSTYEDVPPETTLTLDTVKGYVYIGSPTSLVTTATTRTYNTIEYPTENVLDLSKFVLGDLNDQGVYSAGVKYVSAYSRVYENEEYEYYLPSGSTVFFYTSTYTMIDSYDIVTERGLFVTPPNSKYIRVMSETALTDSMFVRVTDYQNKIYLSEKMYKIIVPDPISELNGELLGINNLMKKFGDLSDRAYEKEYHDMIEAQKSIEERTNELNEFLGDMLREGYWTDDSYVEGDELKLYHDAMDNFEKVAKPEITYAFTFLDLYGSEQEDDVEYQNIRISDAVHLIDDEINTNCWAYIDKLDKCYDKPWETKLEINTNLSLIGQHDFQDVMARIAEVSSETKAKQSIYERAAALTSSGKLAADKLEGALETGKNKIIGGGANWYTDDKGRIVFESSDGTSSMMLSGDGWMLSDAKDAQGEPVYKAIATGQGIVADAITTGTLSAKLIEAGSITADKIGANVGQELEIGSNKALSLFATTDGSRPFDALVTSDAMVEIRSGDGTPENPAKIDIKSGGEINIKSGSSLNIESDGHFNVHAGGNMDISADGVLNVTAEAVFKLDSPNLKVNLDDQGSVIIAGNVNTSGAVIAGFTLGQEVDEHNPEVVLRDYMYVGTNSLDSQESGVYLGTDGVNFGGDFIYRSDDESVRIDDSKTFISNGQTLRAELNKAQSVIAGEKFTLDANTGEAEVPQNQTLNLLTKGNMFIGNGNNFEIGATNSDAYIRNGMTDISDTSHNGIYVGTNGIAAGAGKFKVNNSGIVTASNISVRGGTMDIRDQNNISNFNVTDNGILTAHNATVDGTISLNSGSAIANMKVGSNYIGNQDTITNSTIGFANSQGIVFWAGGEYTSTLSDNNRPNFYVTNEGKLCATEINGKSNKVSVCPNQLDSTYACDIIADTSNQVVNIKAGNKALHFYGTVHSSSSKDVKHNIEAIDNMGSVIDNLNPVSFVYNDDPNEEKKFGLIYEEAINVLPEICTKDDNNKAIDYMQLIPILLKEIQSLRERIKYLENNQERSGLDV